MNSPLTLLQIAAETNAPAAGSAAGSGFQTLELVGVLIIIGVQVVFFINTWRRILLYKNIFRGNDSFFILHTGLLPQYAALHPKELLANLSSYLKQSEPKIVQTELLSENGYVMRPELYETDNRIYIDLIDSKESNVITDKILYSINTYLIRNRGVVADFHLIKDVVERNVDAVENDIQQSVSLPLYLGLLGTFSGIVFGLFQISGFNFSSDSEALNIAIASLLGGVKIAMIASFCGLLLTVLHTGYFFKGAKALVEDKKNDFYTFIQTELLPLLNQGVNSTLVSFQNNMHKFNDEFTINLSKLDGVMGKNYDALIAQEKVLTTLQKMDITEFAQANVKVLQSLQYSIEKFAEFNKYLSGINELVVSTGNVSAKLNEAIGRTDNFYELGKQLTGIFSENQKLIGFLQSHYNSLDESRQLISTAVDKTGDTLLNSLNNLKDFTQDKINEIQKITLKEIDLMRNEYPEKWKKLDHLSYLEPVSKNISEMKMSNASQIGSMANEIKQLNAYLSKVLLQMEAIQKSSAETFTHRLSTSIGGLFKKRKAQ